MKNIIKKTKSMEMVFRTIKAFFVLIFLTLSLASTTAAGNSWTEPQHWSDGYSVQLRYEDPDQTAFLPIPTATITVDGNTTDWSGISELASDPQGDDSTAYTGDDIKALYVAKDADNLYVRMDLWDNANTNFWNFPSPNNGRYAFNIINNGPYSQLYLGVAYDNNISQWSVGFNGSNSSAPDTLQGPSFVGVSGSVIELKVPLTDIGNPTAFYSIRGDVNDCCVYNPDYNPPVTLDEVIATSISVTGPGITGSKALTYNGSGSWDTRTSPSTPVLFGTTYPTGLPFTYTFTITDATGTWTADSTVSCFQPQFATNLSPTGTVTGTPTFSWTGISDSNARYAVELNDSNGNHIWDAHDVTGTSLLYNGPALTPGMTYNYKVVVASSTACSDGSSFAQGSFTLSASLKQLTVSKSGTGSGTVTSSSSGIDCGTTCSASFGSGATVTLTATPTLHSSFTSWVGCTSVSGSTCNVTMSGAKTVTANFTVAPKYTATVTKAGTGTGTVTSSPSGVNCPGDCSELYWKNEVVTLTATATPSAGSMFSGWSGACTGTGSTCVLTMTAAKSVTATFIPYPTLTVVKAGAGTGAITSNDSNINCGNVDVPDCNEVYTTPATVILTATPALHSSFTSWVGCTSVSGNTCTVNMTAVKKVTANFIIAPKYTATVTKAGTGTGTVTSSPSGVNCPGDCSELYWKNEVVTLTATATPSAGSMFSGWSGACTGTGSTCVLTMTAAKSVTATFILAPKYILTLTKGGTGTGTITSDLPGINCPGDCSEPYTSGTSVILTANADSNSVFAGWSGGGCTGTASTCSVTMTASKSVIATFTASPIVEIIPATITIVVPQNEPQTFTISNIGPPASSMQYLVADDGALGGFLDVQNASGTLSGGESATITVSPSSAV